MRASHGSSPDHENCVPESRCFRDIQRTGAEIMIAEPSNAPSVLFLDGAPNTKIFFRSCPSCFKTFARTLSPSAITRTGRSSLVRGPFFLEKDGGTTIV